MASSDQVQRRIQQYGVLRQELIRDLGPVLSERPERRRVSLASSTPWRSVPRKPTPACRRLPMADWPSSSGWARKPRVAFGCVSAGGNQTV